MSPHPSAAVSGRLLHMRKLRHNSGEGARGEREPITGIWGSAPSGVQGQSHWLGG